MRSSRSSSLIFVHQEADRAAVHAVDRLAVVHEAVQRLQHEAVAAERHDGVGLRRLGIAIARDQPLARLECIGHLARDERDPVEFRGGLDMLFEGRVMSEIGSGGSPK